MLAFFSTAGCDPAPQRFETHETLGENASALFENSRRDGRDSRDRHTKEEEERDHVDRVWEEKERERETLFFVVSPYGKRGFSKRDNGPLTKGCGSV